jgi:hypothetical protein
VEDEKLEEKILRKVFIWLVASGAIVGGVSGTGILRVDKFGESDYQLESLKLENKCKEYTDERNIQTKDLKNISELYRHFAQGFALRI